jgi:hypothetical protein
VLRHWRGFLDIMNFWKSLKNLKKRLCQRKPNGEPIECKFQ